jgi:hypothetical protein
MLLLPVSFGLALIAAVLVVFGPTAFGARMSRLGA